MRKFLHAGQRWAECSVFGVWGKPGGTTAWSYTALMAKDRTVQTEAKHT